MNTIAELDTQLKQAIYRRNQAQDVWRRTMIAWTRHDATDAELDNATEALEDAQAELDRLIDSPAMNRMTAAQERAAQKNAYYNGILGR